MKTDKFKGELPDPTAFRNEILEKYPTKVAKKRAKSMLVNDPENIQEIQANVRTIPGIISQRGCTYAGCKGVILGPTRNVVNITHGPIGCGFYSWLTRRNQTHTDSDAEENYIQYCFSTDMQDSNIVFGGEIKLKEAIREAYDLFHPEYIAVFATCPVGLIGDDVMRVAQDMTEELGIEVIGFACEGYKGVSQSAGHHIANNNIFSQFVGTLEPKREGKYRINMLGEYNIGGDAFEIERLLDILDITLVSSFSGNSTVEQFRSAHTADLSVVMCHRSINYIADMLETKYGIPWIKVNFIGAESTAKSLRKIAQYFDDPELTANVEALIAAEMPEVEAVRAISYEKTKDKLAMMFVGGSRAHHYQDLFRELGMKTVSAGYEFAHRDDYEGRAVIPSIKVDADSRNIPELDIEKDEKLYRERLAADRKAKLESENFFREYDGMMVEMDKNSLVIDDISHWETEKLIEFYKPDVFCAGIKEKYVVQKMGIPLKQLHSYDYGGPYAGFKGAINFYQDIEVMVSSNVWKMISAPWESQPELVGRVGTEVEYA
ncbi:MAG: nitrogenase molybdenum-iron protein alpha chain [Bacteroidales bacterium]